MPRFAITAVEGQDSVLLVGSGGLMLRLLICSVPRDNVARHATEPCAAHLIYTGHLAARNQPQPESHPATPFVHVGEPVRDLQILVPKSQPPRDQKMVRLPRLPFAALALRARVDLRE